MNSWDFLDELNAKPVTKPLNGFMVKFPADFNEQEYNNYLDYLEEVSGEQEPPEDYKF